MVTKLKQQTESFSLTRWLRSLWAFARPHTIVGTSLSVGALGIMAWALAADSLSLGRAVGLILAALVPSLCANVYIVGLNQLTDIAIDRINKPKLPLASGAFSVAMGRRIVGVLGALALALSAVQGPILFATVLSSMVIGTVYSLPPLRLKRFPFWAALCIFGVRGLIVNLGFFTHFRRGFSPVSGPAIPAEVWALTGFVVLFSVAIALFKDIPDLEGDRQFHIRTLTVRLGPTFVFNLSLWVLVGSYAMLVALAFTSLSAVNIDFLSITHLGLLGMLLWRARQVKLAQKSHIKQFYQFIWRLFFLEYLLFPMACILGQ